ncbi:hypothetical protein HRbin36_01358 [bacterium HR36]|nr:hypothetical protein HRbin36_01358 [bacterium HR36]
MIGGRLLTVKTFGQSANLQAVHEQSDFLFLQPRLRFQPFLTRSQTFSMQCIYALPFQASGGGFVPTDAVVGQQFLPICAADPGDNLTRTHVLAQIHANFLHAAG